jgi:ATP-dependent RNA helicase RhlE
MTFQELRLAEPIVRAVSDQGYSSPTPIQAQSIPAALEGRDILGCAQTGTGKTCAFALPILHRLSDTRSQRANPSHSRGHHRTPRALVLCPTRELASQIFDSFIDYGRHLKLRHAVVFGGVSQGKQVRALRAGVDVLVATPGRLLDLINQGHIDLRNIETLVLDEADRMLDMGFINDIRKVVDMIPEDRQTLFFSATVSRDIRRLADSMLHDPIRVETAPESTTVEAIAQCVYMIEKRNKPELLERVLVHKDVRRALVFTRTKHGADKLVKTLRRSNIDAEAIHGNKTQNARTRAMKRFKAGSTKVLVATDIASRGIDVDEITHVVNFDMPIDPETYVHRIGRTARAGATGIALSFCDYDELGIYRAIERRTKVSLDIAENHSDLTFDAPPPQRREYPTNRGQQRKRYPSKRTQSARGETAGTGSDKPRRNRKGKPNSTSHNSSANNSNAASRMRKSKVKRRKNTTRPTAKPSSR